MPETQERLLALEAQVAALLERLTALEARIPPEGSSLPSPHKFTMTTFSQPGQRQPHEANAVQGTLMYAGFAQIAGKPYQIQRQQQVAPLFEMAPEALAQVFAALASPHRVIILRLLCQGPRTSQQLQEALGMSSAGQLYHHLKELLAVGLIVQRGRSDYSIDPDKVITICIALMVASHFLRAYEREEPPSDQGTEGHEQT